MSRTDYRVLKSHIVHAPVSYDINKDGFRIATLTLVKSAYRLGDTVTAMITLNNGKARVLRVGRAHWHPDRSPGRLERL